MNPQALAELTNAKITTKSMGGKLEKDMHNPNVWVFTTSEPGIGDSEDDSIFIAYISEKTNDYPAGWLMLMTADSRPIFKGVTDHNLAYKKIIQHLSKPIKSFVKMLESEIVKAKAGNIPSIAALINLHNNLPD